MFDVLIRQQVQQLMKHRIHRHVSYRNRKFDLIMFRFFFLQVNLDRGRGELENDIRKLLNDIRDRRARLVHENSQSIPYLPTSTEKPAAIS